MGARVLARAQSLADIIADVGSTSEQVAAAQGALRQQVELIEVMRAVLGRFEDAGFTGVNEDSLGP